MLAQGPHSLRLNLVEIQHPHEIHDTDGADDVADDIRAVDPVGADLVDGAAHADDTFTENDESKETKTLDQHSWSKTEESDVARDEQDSQRFDGHEHIPRDKDTLAGPGGESEGETKPDHCGSEEDCHVGDHGSYGFLIGA